METDTIIQYVFIGLAAALVGYLLYEYYKSSNNNVEKYQTYAPVSDNVDVSGDYDMTMDDNMQMDNSQTADNTAQMENTGLVAVGSTSNMPQMNNVDANCRPKDILTSADLLPNIMGSTWEQVNPQGQGSLGDQNFLTAGYNLGINTVGSSLRNANKQLRSDPVIPKNVVSPWGQSTIDADIGRRCLEVGSDSCP